MYYSVKNKDIPDKQEALDAIMTREKSMSTGLSAGLAIPHARIDSIQTIKLAIGILPDGVDFDSIDQKPSKVIILMLSPSEQNSSHLQLMSNIISLFNNDMEREKLITCTSSHSVIDFLSEE